MNRELKFNHKKFEKFKDKIIYIIYEESIHQKIEINMKIVNKTKTANYMNALIEKMDKEIYITRGIKKANDDDII